MVTEAAPGLRWGGGPRSWRGGCADEGGGSGLCPARACDRLGEACHMGGLGAPATHILRLECEPQPQSPASGHTHSSHSSRETRRSVPPWDSRLGEGLGSTVTDLWDQTWGLEPQAPSTACGQEDEAEP